MHILAGHPPAFPGHTAHIPYQEYLSLPARYRQIPTRIAHIPTTDPSTACATERATTWSTPASPWARLLRVPWKIPQRCSKTRWQITSLLHLHGSALANMTTAPAMKTTSQKVWIFVPDRQRRTQKPDEEQTIKRQPLPPSHTSVFHIHQHPVSRGTTETGTGTTPNPRQCAATYYPA